jgi:hypothetical protein
MACNHVLARWSGHHRAEERRGESLTHITRNGGSDTGVAPVVPSNRGQHRHQRRCRRRRLERVDGLSYQGKLGAPPTISRRWSCRGQRSEARGDRSRRPPRPHRQAEPRLGFLAGRGEGEQARTRERPSKQDLAGERRHRSWPAAAGRRRRCGGVLWARERQGVRKEKRESVWGSMVRSGTHWT